MSNGSYRDVIIDNFGRAIDSVSVTVKLQGTGTLATIFSDRAGTALANPFTNEADGSFEFWASADIRLDVTFSKTGVTFDNTDTLDIEVSGFVADSAVTDAKIAATGVTTRSKLPAAVAYEDEANIFTFDQKISKAAPILLFDNTTASATGGLIGSTSADVVAMRLNETAVDTQEDAAKPSWSVQLENDIYRLYRKPPAGAYAVVSAIDNTGKQTVGTVPLARMGLVVVDASTAVSANSAAAVLLSSAITNPVFYIISLRSSSTIIGWHTGTSVSAAEAVLADLHSTISREAAGGTADQLNLVNGTGVNDTAVYKVYTLTEV